jgi:hypothetical protein
MRNLEKNRKERVTKGKDKEKEKPIVTHIRDWRFYEVLCNFILMKR